MVFLKESSFQTVLVPVLPIGPLILPFLGSNVCTAHLFKVSSKLICGYSK